MEYCFIFFFFFFSSRRRHTRSDRDWSSDVCSSDLPRRAGRIEGVTCELRGKRRRIDRRSEMQRREDAATCPRLDQASVPRQPLPGAIRRPSPEITAYRPPADIIELRDDQRVAEPVVAHLTIDTMRTQDATACDVAYADAASATAVVVDIGDG